MNSRYRANDPIEFRLAVKCCRWAYAHGDDADIIRLAQQIDGPRFLAVARRHRVQGLIWHCLGTLNVPLPAELSDALQGDAYEIAERGLRTANELAQFSRIFAEAGIPLIFIKGLTLAKLAFSNPFLKMSWDIDLLVPAGQVTTAAAELERMGYRLVIPAKQSGSVALGQWHQNRKESVWYKEAGPFHVELHSALADNRRLIPTIGINSPRQLVEIAPGIVLPTLASQELFAYLCVHGASSAWFRLKWITDLAALLSQESASEIDRLYERSQQLGAGRAAAQALLVAHELYAIRLSDSLKQALLSEYVNRRLAAVALRELTATSEPTQHLLGTAAIHLSQLDLLPGWRFKLSEAARQLGHIVGRVPL